jgi:A/G-specific adenine glycosylase
VQVARVPPDAAPLRGSFLPETAFRPGDLPSLMQKAADIARTALADG